MSSSDSVKMPRPEINCSSAASSMAFLAKFSVRNVGCAAHSRAIGARLEIDFCDKSNRDIERFTTKPSHNASSTPLVVPSDSSPTLNDCKLAFVANAAPSALAALVLSALPEAENSFNVVFVFNNSLRNQK